MTDEDVLSIWTIYDHPKDFPDYFVARRFALDKPTDDVLLSKDLDELRDNFVRHGLTVLCRSTIDDPVIIEVWL